MISKALEDRLRAAVWRKVGRGDDPFDGFAWQAELEMTARAVLAEIDAAKPKQRTVKGWGVWDFDAPQFTKEQAEETARIVNEGLKTPNRFAAVFFAGTEGEPAPAPQEQRD